MSFVCGTGTSVSRKAIGINIHVEEMLECSIINQKDKLIRGASFKAWSLSSGLHLIRGELRSIS